MPTFPPSQVLHVFLPPLNTPADCSPYAAWRMEAAPTAPPAPAAGGRQAPPPQPAVSAVVAVAWQTSVSVYRTVLLWRRAPMQVGHRGLFGLACTGLARTGAAPFCTALPCVSG